jgi:hypothetical protein
VLLVLVGDDLHGNILAVAGVDIDAVELRGVRTRQIGLLVMRIRNTEDYKKYLAKLGKCSCGCCKEKHCGKVENGCGFPKDSSVSEATSVNSKVWDGKDFAAIQTITADIPRRNGRPAAEVDKDWNLTVLDVPVPVGWRVYEDGQVTPDEDLPMTNICPSYFPGYSPCCGDACSRP